jgi:hypothetical protein
MNGPELIHAMLRLSSAPLQYVGNGGTNLAAPVNGSRSLAANGPTLSTADSVNRRQVGFSIALHGYGRLVRIDELDADNVVFEFLDAYGNAVKQLDVSACKGSPF